MDNHGQAAILEIPYRSGPGSEYADSLWEPPWQRSRNHPIAAVAILDRLVHRSHRLALKGESLRRTPPEKRANNAPS